MKRSQTFGRDSSPTWVYWAAFCLVVLIITVIYLPHYAYADDDPNTDMVVGAVVSPLSLYESPQDNANKIGEYPVGKIIACIADPDGNSGWYAAYFTLNGEKTVAYFKIKGTLVKYTAASNDVLVGAALGDGSVYTMPKPDSDTIRPLEAGELTAFVNFNDEYVAARFGDEIGYMDSSQFVLYSSDSSQKNTVYAGENGAEGLEAPTEDAQVIDSYTAGEKLGVNEFNDTWFIIKDGDAYQYIRKSDTVDQVETESTDYEGDVWIITNDSTKAYLSASLTSACATTYGSGTVLNACEEDNDWYSSSIVLNGCDTTVYLPSASVTSMTGDIKVVQSDTNYSITLAKALSLQASKSKGNSVQKNNSWVFTEDEDVIKDYMDPAVTPQGTTGFFQFLRLDTPAGFSVESLNRVLKGDGIFEGHGQAFSDAAYGAGINEAYIISHALLETGEGTSQMATGLWYTEDDRETPEENDEKVSYKKFSGATLVYNMFGIGAIDSDPTMGAARTAYSMGWTTVDKAIIGGAAYVGQYYIPAGNYTLSGQNTLYKMRWHPEYTSTYQKSAWHEYASDVHWAIAQTYYLTKVYAEFDAYTLTFDVPHYA